MDQLGAVIQLVLFHATTALFACIKATFVGSVFALTGFVLIPNGLARRYQLDGFDFVVIGMTLYVLGCWAAITHDHSITPIIQLLLIGAPVALAVRGCRWGAQGKRVIHRAITQLVSVAKPILLFNCFAIIMYLLHYYRLRPDKLPFVFSGNLDLVQYSNAAMWLRAVGGNLHGNIPDYDFEAFATHDVFGAISLVSLFQFLPRTNVYDFAIPAMLFTGAGCALAIFDCLRRIFFIGRPGAFFVALLSLANPLNFYIVYNFFFSQMIATLAVVLLIYRTLRRSREGASIWKQIIAALPFYILQLFCYPPGLLFTLVLHGVVLTALDVLRTDKGKLLRSVTSLKAFASPVQVLGSMILAIGVSTAAFPGRTGIVWDKLAVFAAPGVAGWPLPLVSPFVLLGIGGIGLGIETRAPLLFSACYAVLLPILLAAPFLLHFRDGTVPPKWQAAFAAEVAFTAMFLGYVVYYLIVGPSYQQWKAASYGAVAFCWIALAQMILASAHIGDRVLAYRHFGSRFLLIVFLVLFALDIKSNGKFSGIQIPAGIASISAIDSMQIDRLALDLDRDYYADQTIAPGFIKRPALYMAWGLAYPRTLPDDYRPSRQFPLLTRGTNCGGPNEEGIEALRDQFTLVTRNTLPIGSIVDFHQPLACPGIFDATGVGVAEATGRGTEGTEARFHFYLDQSRLGRDVAMTLVAGAYKAAGTPEQSVEVVVNGRSLAFWRYTSFNAEPRVVLIPHDVAMEHSGLEIVFKLPNAISLAGPSHGKDRRVVALILQTLSFTTP